MKGLLVLATAGFVTASSLAHAAPPSLTAEPEIAGSVETTSYVSAGMTSAEMSDLGFAAGLEVEAGHRLGRTPLWAHAALAGGTIWTANVLGPQIFTSFVRARAGTELRYCTSGGGKCLFGGVDVGERRMESLEMDAPQNELIVMPQGGLDVGNARWRFRWEMQESIGMSGRQHEHSGSAALAYCF
jgi:hypothetical protein